MAEARILKRLRTFSDAVSAGETDVVSARAAFKLWLDAAFPGKYDPEDGRISNLASTARLNLIFRQNAAMAAAVGRYRYSRDPDVELMYPSWRYLAGPNPRAAHAALDGKVYKKSDPIWKRIYPPWEFNCNCDVEDVEEENPEPSAPPDVPDAPESGFKFDPDRAFDGRFQVDDPEVAAIVTEQLKKRFPDAEK